MRRNWVQWNIFQRLQKNLYQSPARQCEKANLIQSTFCLQDLPTSADPKPSSGLLLSCGQQDVIAPRFRCATLDRSDQTVWVAHLWRGATQNTWSGNRLSRTMVWSVVAPGSDQRTKSANWSGQWSHDGLIRRQSRAIVWSQVALKSGQWSHYGLITGHWT